MGAERQEHKANRRPVRTELKRCVWLCEPGNVWSKNPCFDSQWVIAWAWLGLANEPPAATVLPYGLRESKTPDSNPNNFNRANKSQYISRKRFGRTASIRKRSHWMSSLYRQYRIGSESDAALGAQPIRQSIDFTGSRLIPLRLGLQPADPRIQPSHRLPPRPATGCDQVVRITRGDVSPADRHLLKESATAQNVEWYRARWAANGWHCPQTLLCQPEVGRRAAQAPAAS